MKKLLTCAMAALFTLSVVGCSKEEPKKDTKPTPAPTTDGKEKPKDAH